MVIDTGLPSASFADLIDSFAPYIDTVKFGWGTALVTRGLESKIECLRANAVRWHFGGTLFEKFVAQDRFDGFLALCRRWGCDLVEISNGTIPLSNIEKAAYIRKCVPEFEVVSEVGFKDAGRSERLSSAQWVDAIGEDLEAGAAMVTTEARESGRSGICRADGNLRRDLVDDILGAGFYPEQLLFEAPTKALQTHFVTKVGPNVNLGNIAPADVAALETLRLGLRADTLLHFDGAAFDA
jgi:phosphosulfolactate synthase